MLESWLIAPILFMQQNNRQNGLSKCLPSILMVHCTNRTIFKHLIEANLIMDPFKTSQFNPLLSLTFEFMRHFPPSFLSHKETTA